MDIYFHKKFLSSSLLQYIVAAFSSLLILFSIIHIWKLPLFVPYSYSGDALFYSVLIKSIIDTGWYVTNSLLGAPNGFNLADFPMMTDNFYLFVIKIMSLFIHHYAVLLNLYFILMFPAITIIALFVLKKLRLRYPFALAGALLFTFQAYHIYRGIAHLALSSYCFVPLGIWLAVIIGTGRKIFDWSLNVKNILYGFICILIGSSGIYYAYFSMFFVCIAGVMASVDSKKFSSFFQAVFVCFIIFITILANLLPAITYKISHGANQVAAYRAPQESEVFGLKITQMLLPVTDHRLGKLNSFKMKYDQTAPLVNENCFSTLGFIGSLGFLFLLGVSIFNIRAIKELKLISTLNICAILMATMGGFGSFFAYTFSPMIRAYNRMSIFIAFFSLYAFFYFLQQYLSKSTLFQWKIVWTLVISLITFGVLDQSGEYYSPIHDYKEVAIEFNTDKKFIKEIEKIMPSGSMIYQMPYMPFPGSAPIANMTDYQHFHAYLHSYKNIMWSYGAMKGRPLATWLEHTSTLPIKEMLNQLIYAGYTGIYINRQGYVDHGVEIEQQIYSFLNTPPLISMDKNLSFFDLHAYAQSIKKNELRLATWKSNVLKIKLFRDMEINWEKGFSGIEGSGENSFRWSDKKARLLFINTSQVTQRVKLSFTAITSGESNLVLKSTLMNAKLKVNNQGTNFSREISIPPGKSTIYFYSDAARVAAPADPRHLYFRLREIKLDVLS